MKKQYEEIRRKYDLPEYEIIEKIFRLDAVEEENVKYFLVEIIQKIKDKLRDYIAFLDQFLLSDHEYKILVETNAFDDNEKKKIKTYLKNINITYNKLNYYNLKSDIDEETFAGLIKDSLETYKKFSEILNFVTEKINKQWQELDLEGEQVFEKGYLG